MGRIVNYRKLLTKAVQLFLEQTPDAKERALRIVRRCLHAEVSFSLDSIVWGGMISALTDVVYYDNLPYLLGLRDMLAGKSLTRERTYINYNFRDELTPHEALWLDKARELLSFLQRFSFADREREAGEEVQSYKGLAAELRSIRDRAQIAPSWGEETIYHLTLREVTAIVINIDLEVSVSHHGYLTPQTPYATMSEEANFPDAAETLTWAKKALDAITGKGWMLVTWQITPDQVHLSFH